MLHEEIAWVREIETEEYGTIIAACDRELLGRKLKKNNLEIVVSERFYGGRLVNKEELIILFKNADVLNLLGEKVIKLAEDLGLIHSEAKIFFEDEDGRKIPHAQLYRFSIH